MLAWGGERLLHPLAEQKVGIQDQIYIAFRAVGVARRNGDAAVRTFQRYGIGGQLHARIHSFTAKDDISDATFRQDGLAKESIKCLCSLT
jgi:hypothetical protein